MGRSTLNHRTAISRYSSLALALFIFIVTAFVHLTHSNTDFQSIACEPASYASNGAQSDEDQQPCLACLIVKAFLTAQIILFVLLLFIAAASDFRRSYESKFHSVSFLTYRWIRGPPPLASFFLVSRQSHRSLLAVIIGSAGLQYLPGAEFCIFVA